MKPIDQTVFGGDKGNCFSAVVASLLELPLEEVPFFMGPGDWEERFNLWLIERGMMSVDVDEGSVGIADHQYHMMGGPSPRGDFYHSVVGRGGKMVHDPHPSRDGLVSVKTWRFIIPHDPAKAGGSHQIPRPCSGDDTH